MENKNKIGGLVPAWGQIVSICILMAMGMGLLNDSEQLTTVGGVAIIVFGIWSSVVIIKHNK